MTESSAPFTQPAGGYDETATRGYFKKIMPQNGVERTTAAWATGDLAVYASTPAAMTVQVAAGKGWVQGGAYDNSAAKAMTIAAAHATLDRTDTIVMRMTISSPNSAIVLAVLKGDDATAGTSVPKALTTNDTGVYEVALGYVLVSAAVTSIAGTGTTLITNARVCLTGGGLTFTFDEGGDVISTGVKGYITIPFNCYIDGFTLLASPSGSMVVDIHKSTYAAFPTTASICASELPTLSGAQKATNRAIASWTKTLTEGDILEFHVDSCATITRASVSLRLSRVPV